MPIVSSSQKMTGVTGAGTDEREEELLQSGLERTDRLHRDVPTPLPADQDPAQRE